MVNNTATSEPKEFPDNTFLRQISDTVNDTCLFKPKNGTNVKFSIHFKIYELNLKKKITLLE